MSMKMHLLNLNIWMLQDVSQDGITKELTWFEPSHTEVRVLTNAHISVGYHSTFCCILEVCSDLLCSPLSVSDRAM